VDKTDSKVTLDTLQNRNKHYILIGNLRKEIKRLKDQQWTVLFNWVKAHVGIEGNEMADRLAKKVATDDAGELVYDKIPRETIITEEKEIEVTKWQEQWINSTKGAVIKLFFAYINERIQTIIPISAEFTAMVTGHGLTRSYRHRFKIISQFNVPLWTTRRTINHKIFDFTQMENKKRILRNAIVRTGDTWPPPSEQLTRKHINTFTKFITSIDFNVL